MKRRRGRVSVNKRATKLRVRNSGRDRILVVAVCITLIVLLVILSAWLYGWSNFWNVQAGRVLILLTGFPLLFIFISLICPQWVVRISPKGLQRARTYHIRQRISLRWHDIEQLRWGNVVVAMKSADRQIWISFKYMKSEDVQRIRTRLTSHLKQRFDLDNPGAGELREAAKRSSPVMNAVIVAHLLVLPLVYFAPANLKWALLLPLATLTLAVAMRNIMMHRNMWRRPREMAD